MTRLLSHCVSLCGIALLAPLMPGRAYQRLTARSAAGLVALLILLELSLLCAIVLTKPAALLQPVVASYSQRGHNSTSALQEAEARFSRFIRLTMFQRLRTNTIDTLLLVVFWTAVGLLIHGRGVRISAVFRAVAIAGVVSTLLFLARYSLLGITGHDVSSATAVMFGSVLGHSPSGFFRQVGLGPIWWAIIAGAGFSKAWDQPLHIATTLVLAGTLTWFWNPAHLHW